MSEEVVVDVKSVEIELKNNESQPLTAEANANAANAQGTPTTWPAPASENVVIAFINFNSGGKMGEELTARLQKVLGNDRVFNLSDGGPKKGLTKWFGHPNLRVVIGGGDGTINWVLSAIRSLYSSPSSLSSAAAAAASIPPPPAGFIPLGTGNDTSRVFGWGFKYPGNSRIQHNVERMKTGGFAWFDRFHVSIEREKQPPEEILKHFPHSFSPITNAREQFPAFLYQRPEELPRARFFVDTVKSEGGEKKEHETKSEETEREEGNGKEEKIVQNGSTTGGEFVEYSTKVTHAAEFNNYLSFGLDAQTMNGFHSCRENYRGCFPCRCCNMAWVGICGAKVTCFCQWRKFDVDVLVRDGEEWRKLQLPSSIHAVVLLNVWSYGGGRRPWGKKIVKTKSGEDAKQSMNDGLLEIIGIGSPIHLSVMMLHLTSGIKLAQAAEVKIVMRRPLHVQIDGEPWEDYPAIYHVRALPRARILVNEDVKEALGMPVEPLGGIATHS